MNDEPRRRASSLGPTEMYLLQQWARSVREAFDSDGAAGMYLVGSATTGGPHRDVDVRMMLPDERFATLTEGRPQQLEALNVAMTVWGQRATGLPIDFQFQDHTDTNSEHSGRRHAIGLRTHRGPA